MYKIVNQFMPNRVKIYTTVNLDCFALLNVDNLLLIIFFCSYLIHISFLDHNQS